MKKTQKLAWIGFLAMAGTVLTDPRRGLSIAWLGAKNVIAHVQDHRRQLSVALLFGFMGAGVGVAWSISSSSAFLAVEVFADGMEKMSQAERQLPRLENMFATEFSAKTDADQATDLCSGSKDREWRGTAIMSASVAASCKRSAEGIASWQTKIISRLDFKTERSRFKNALHVETLLDARAASAAFSEALSRAESRESLRGATLDKSLSMLAARWTFALKLLRSHVSEHSPPYERGQESMASNVIGACSILGFSLGFFIGLYLFKIGVVGTLGIVDRVLSRSARAALSIKQCVAKNGKMAFVALSVLGACWLMGSTLSFVLLASSPSAQYSLAPAWVLDGSLSRMCDDDARAEHCDPKLRARITAALDEGRGKLVAIESRAYTKIKEELSIRFAPVSRSRFFKITVWTPPAPQSSFGRSVMGIRGSILPLVDSSEFSAWLPLVELPAWRAKTTKKNSTSRAEPRLSEPWQDWTAREWIAVATNQVEISTMLAEASKPAPAMTPSSYDAASPWTNIPPEFKAAIIEEKLLPALRDARGLAMSMGGLGLILLAVAIAAFLFNAASLLACAAKAKATQAIKSLERRGEAAAALAERDDLLSVTATADHVPKKTALRL